MFSEVEIQGLVYNLLQYINNNQLREQIAILCSRVNFSLHVMLGCQNLVSM